MPQTPPRGLSNGSDSTLNFDEALERLGGDHDLLAEAIDLFAEDTGPQIDSVRESVQSGDLQHAVITAHGMSSAARSIGAEKVADAWKQFELFIRKYQGGNVAGSASTDGHLRIISECTKELIDYWNGRELP